MIYDCSGYGNHGTVNNITIDSSSPKYNNSSVFTRNNSSYIKVTDNNWMAQGAPEYTINLWAYADDWTTEGTKRLISCTESGGFNTEQGTTGYMRHAIHVYTNSGLTSATYMYDSNAINLSDLTAGWHMFSFVYTTSAVKIYIDSELWNTYEYTSYGIHFNTTGSNLFLGCEANATNPASPYFNGRQSDFRFYYTALSAQDIKDLYNIGMSIDNKQNIHTYKLNEDSSTTDLKKTGVLNAKDIFSEYDSTAGIGGAVIGQSVIGGAGGSVNVGIYKSGLITANQFYED